MPNNACATIATAAIFNPWIVAATIGPDRSAASRATSNIISAEGRVNAVHAASPPKGPARINPIAKPTWLDAGPGKNWHRPTNSP